jgi:hypothetical protein
MLSPVQQVSQVLDAIQQARTGASVFGTNFFPVQSKLQAWIDHQELWAGVVKGAALFLRKDRNFWHLFFSASNPEALEQALQALPQLKTERVVTDVVGKEGGPDPFMAALERARFRPYSKLLRLARPSMPEGEKPTMPARSAPVLASKTQSSALLALIESFFDPYADQIPLPYEIEAAIASQQIFVVQPHSEVAALLFFETQGLTSTIRYWVVGQKFLSHGFGSALIRHYFLAHNKVRRFVLWVAANNDNALRKYQHYGYAPDGLVDHVLVNELIRP